MLWCSTYGPPYIKLVPLTPHSFWLEQGVFSTVFHSKAHANNFRLGEREVKAKNLSNKRDRAGLIQW